MFFLCKMHECWWLRFKDLFLSSECCEAFRSFLLKKKKKWSHADREIEPVRLLSWSEKRFTLYLWILKRNKKVWMIPLQLDIWHFDLILQLPSLTLERYWWEVCNQVGITCWILKQKQNLFNKLVVRDYLLTWIISSIQWELLNYSKIDGCSNSFQKRGK